MFERTVDHVYQDPIDLIWLAAARELGFCIERTNDAFASWDGEVTLAIATSEHFDPDDSLAQMILHEICHALVAGPAQQQLPDWGLSNDDARDLVVEHAVHRLQAALSEPHGLRAFMAVTTEWRPYWDQLPADPLRDGTDPAIELAQRGYQRAELQPHKRVLERALSRTAQIADIVRELGEDSSLWRRTRARHKTGLLLHDDSALRCGDCAWCYSSGAHASSRCRQSKRGAKLGVRVEASEAACERWEPRFDEQECASCGACCREAFDLVAVRPREAFRRLHPELVQISSIGPNLPRPEGRCPVLVGTGSRSEPYRCRYYAERPRSCAEFRVAEDACLEARRRVGLSK